MASSNLNTKLKLKEVSEKLDDSEYNPDNFPGVIWRPKSSYGVVIIMEDGRLMCTNVRSIEDVDKIFDQLTKNMEKNGLITPRLSCSQCGAIVDAEDVVCIECGFLLQG
jgi:transcription initiation factor TFIID TATA-box-binding protein